MHCPICGYKEAKVVDSRLSEDGISIRRRRECESCKRRYTTVERVELKKVEVRKRDGKTEMYNREKLYRAINYACAKRGRSDEEINSLIDGVEQEILARAESEIYSKEIGEIVLKHLQSFDEVAFIRFKSVFNRFASPEDFKKLLLQL